MIIANSTQGAVAHVSKSSQSWFLPTPELMSGMCRLTRTLHRVAAVCGLALGIGGTLAEHLRLASGLLDVTGVILGFVLAFALIAAAPLSLAALIACPPRPQRIAEAGLLWIFVGTLWLTDGEDMLVTVLFLIYATVVLALWVREVIARLTDAGYSNGRPN